MSRNMFIAHPKSALHTFAECGCAGVAARFMQMHWKLPSPYMYEPSKDTTFSSKDGRELFRTHDDAMDTSQIADGFRFALTKLASGPIRWGLGAI